MHHALMVVALSCAVPGVARAAGDVVADLGGGARVDWTRGLVIAPGAAHGDVRAPTAAVARVKAERRARLAAHDRLRELVAALPLASDAESGAADRARRAVDHAFDLDVDYGADGSVVVTAAVAVDAVRTAVYGADAPPEGEGGASVVLVTGASVDEPVVGLVLSRGDERYRGPVIYARRRSPALAKWRKSAVRAAAGRHRPDAGVLELGKGMDEAALGAARRARALVVVVGK